MPTDLPVEDEIREWLQSEAGWLTPTSPFSFPTPVTPPPSTSSRLLEPFPQASTSAFTLDSPRQHQPAFFAPPPPNPFSFPSPAPSPVTTPRRRRTSSVAVSKTLKAGPALTPKPSKENWLRLPLETLLEAGTIILSGFKISDDVMEMGEGDWAPLSATSLKVIDSGVVETEEDSLEFTTVEEESRLPSPPPTPKPNKGKRKASTSSGKRSYPKKRKLSISLPGSPRSDREVLKHVLTMQDALNIRVTFKSGKPGEDEERKIILRVYLVPSDLKELKELRLRKSHVSVSTCRDVFGATKASRTEWDGVLSEDVAPSFFDDLDKRSLLEVYRELSSPPDSENFIENLQNLSPTVKERLQDALVHSPPGMITTLFGYQNASLAKMLQRELAPQYVDDPSFLPRTDLSGQQFFVSVDGEVCLSVPFKFLEPKGGFLSEDMGTGKTAICISLVLSTLTELPDVTNGCTHLDNTPSPPPLLLTSVSLDFPSSIYRNEVRRLQPRVVPPLPGYESLLSSIELQEYYDALQDQKIRDDAQQRPPIPSLRDIALNIIKTSTGKGFFTSDADPRISGSRLGDNLERTIPFYFVHPSPEQLQTREGRKGAFKASKIFVVPTTLVVVPGDLIRQWKGEIEKHVDLEKSGLRYRVLRTSKDDFPTVEEISKLDVILMSIARFSDAAGDLKSTLRNVHWKRLIVDEGHTAAGNNRIRKLSEELRCECSWVISGTPTKNLRGGDDQSTMFAMKTLVGGDESDFDRIGQIFSRFLKHPAFAKPERWRHVITNPVMLSRGISRLAAVMDRAFVRNRPEKIAQSYTLKKLSSEVVYLDLLPSERLTYNCLLALFKFNAIQSQRTDRDYLFHQNQKKYLDELTLNLSASSFFFASDAIIKWLTGAITYAKDDLAAPKSERWTLSDRETLVDSIRRVEEAMNDPEWNTVVKNTSVLLEMEGLHGELLKLFNALEAQNHPRGKTMIPPGSLVTLRRDLKAVRTCEGQPAWRDDEDLIEEVNTFEQLRLRRENETAPTEDLPKEKKPRVPHPVHPLPLNSIFSLATLGQSTSAKLNYVVDQLRMYPDEKFIVFSSTLPDLIFAHLSECLDCLHIQHIIFAGHGKGRDRGAAAAKFNTTTAKECQAILIDARLGGRGVHLTAASRVIFLNPIWDPDLEIQSARRAHRLGQTEPVDLKILVIRDSYEHELLRRRSQLSQSDFTKIKQPQGDPLLREVLQSAKFIDSEASPILEDEVVRTPLLSLEEGGTASRRSLDEAVQELQDIFEED